MISIIDYKAGNLTSVKRALDYLNIESEITADPSRIENAERIILPGVGHAATAVAIMKERKLDIALKNAFDKGIPIMGICLGTQIILSFSEEGDTDCLGIIPGKCLKFNLKNPSLKIPHMGWNKINQKKEHFILKDLRKNDELYFVHSYYPSPENNDAVYATTEYEIEFCCAMGIKNLFATQFHPEKSGPIGLQVLKNFSEWDGTSC